MSMLMGCGVKLVKKVEPAHNEITGYTTRSYSTYDVTMSLYLETYRWQKGAIPYMKDGKSKDIYTPNITFRMTEADATRYRNGLISVDNYFLSSRAGYDLMNSSIITPFKSVVYYSSPPRADQMNCPKDKYYASNQWYQVNKYVSSYVDGYDFAIFGIPSSRPSVSSVTVTEKVPIYTYVPAKEYWVEEY